jgi:hypothetical protein
VPRDFDLGAQRALREIARRAADESVHAYSAVAVGVGGFHSARRVEAAALNKSAAAEEA